MRALEIYPSFGIENLRIAERPDPSPGPGEVALRVRAVSLNFRDLATVRGINYPKIELPRIPCSDGAGEIVALGEGVDQWSVGDRVMGLFMPAWLDGPLTAAKAASSLGGLVDGMAGELRILPASGVMTTPEHLTDAEAATLPCAALTAWNALFENRPIEAGQTVVVRGTGGVAIFALQLAKAAGARVLATSGSDAKRTRAEELGADATCNYHDSDWVAWTLDQTGGEGADVIVDSVGGSLLNESMAAVRMGGYIALMGVLAGLEAPVRTVDILRKNIHLQGIYVGSRTMFERMNRFLRDHRIHPVISHRFPLAESGPAFECMAAGDHFGKIVLEFP